MILTVAVRHADQYGVESLSMRVLARELGCGVMSLYNHVSDKDDLLNGMVGYVAAEIELPIRKGSARTWLKDLRACAISAYKVMLHHRWVAKIWGRDTGPEKNRYHETVLRIMREAGFPEELACRGFHAVTMHVVGFALQVLDMPFTTKEEIHDIGHRVMGELSEDEFPYLREHVQFHLDGRDKRNDFKFMLDLILEGLASDLDDSNTT